MRLYFGQVELGEGSFLRATAELDGETQKLDAGAPSSAGTFGDGLALDGDWLAIGADDKSSKRRSDLCTEIGGIAGAFAFGFFHPTIKPDLLTGGPGKVTYADLTGLPFWLLALIAAGLLVAVIAALERRRPWRSELGEKFDGIVLAADPEIDGRIER